MSWIDNLKYQYNKGDSAIRRLLFLNVGVFLFVGIARVFARLYKINTAEFNEALNYLSLTANLEILITKPWSLVTYMFMHAGIFHILFNMLWLYYIGGILEGFIGKAKTYTAYFVSGALGALVHIAAFYAFPVFHDQLNIATVGASGAVFGIMTATITLVPEYSIRLMLLGTVKLRWIVIAYIALNFLQLGGGGNTSHTVHLGGALMGFLYIRYIQGRLGFTLPKVNNPFKRSKLKVERNKASVNNYSKQSNDQDEVDAILDKISKSGYGSLTQHEKDVLFKASQKED